MNDKRSYTEYTVTTATTDFVIGFDDYDDGTKDTIVVTVNGVLAESQGYAVMRKNAQVVTITPAVQSGTVRLTRVTDIDESFHQFTAGALFSAKSVDENFQQVRHSQQEVRDGFVFLEYNTNGIVQASKEATAQAKAATVEATASAVRAESAADTAVQAVGSLQGVVDAATTATATATTAASQATAATTTAQHAAQAANTAKKEATTATANAKAATVANLAATGRANEAAAATESAIEDAKDLVGFVTSSVLYTAQNVQSGKQVRIPSTVSHVRTQAFATIGGGARYVRSTLAKVTPYPTVAWFQSLDGAYWLLDEDKPDPTMFGGKPASKMSELTHVRAVDSTLIITAAREYALKRRVPLYFKGYYMWMGTLLMKPEECFKGIGRYFCGIQVRNDGQLKETGLQIKVAGVKVTGMELQNYLYGRKADGGGTGMVGVSLIVGNFTEGDIPKPRDYYIDDVLLSRKDSETGYPSYTGIALHISGGSNAGYVGVVEVTGRHSVAYMSHWNGNMTKTHGVATESVSPRNYTLEKLIVHGTIGTLITLSSVSNVRIKSVMADKCGKIMEFLPGDETDDFNIGDPNVGAGIRIDELVCNNVHSSSIVSHDDAMSISTMGTSKFQLVEGQAKQTQLRMDVSIGSLTLHSDDPSILYAIDLFYFYGVFHVEHARITGFKYPLRANNSRGDISIHFDFSDGAVVLKNSDVNLTGSISLKDANEVPHVNDWGVFVSAESFTAPISGITRGDTTLRVPGGLPKRLERGSIVEITGIIDGTQQTVEYPVNKLVSAGLTVIDIGVVFQNNQNTATLKYKAKSDVSINMRKLEGAYAAVDVRGGNVTVKGEVTGSRYNVIGSGTDTKIHYEVSSYVRGQYRMEGISTSLYDLYVQEGCIATITGRIGGGKLANTGTYKSIGGAVTGTPSKVFLHNAVVVDTTKVVSLSTHLINMSVAGCVTETGELFDMRDIAGVTKRGTNENGSFVRHPDGVLECWVRNLPITAAAFTWNFPASFLNTADISVTSMSGSPTSTRTVAGYATTVRTASIGIRDSEGANISSSANLHAIGFWK